MSSDIAWVAEAAYLHFGLETHALRPLGSCEDLNFKLVSRDKDGNEKIYVVKYTNSTVKVTDIVFQHKVQKFLRSNPLGKELQFPEPLPTKYGDGSTCVEQVVGAKSYTMHILSYVDGEMFSDNSYFSSFSLMNFGKSVAQINEALKGFPHEIVSRKSQWDLRYGFDICMSQVQSIKENAVRDKILLWANRANKIIQSHASDLRVQLVHGDLAPYNVVSSSSDNRRPIVKGIIDFGDMTESWLVGDLAIAVTPFISNNLKHFLENVVTIVKGFQQSILLNEAEAAVLWPLIVLRSMILYSSATKILEDDSENRYLLDELELNKKIVVKVTSIPMDIGILAVKAAAGFSCSKVISHSLNSIFKNFCSVRYLDMSVESETFLAGDWLLPDKVKVSFEKSSDNGEIVATKCGVPWLVATALRKTDSPKTIPTFSLLVIPSGAVLHAPGSGTVSLCPLEVLRTSGWLSNDCIYSFLPESSFMSSTLLLSLSNGLSIVIVGASLVKDPGIINEGEAFAITHGDKILIQSSITTTSDSFNLPPLFCSNIEWSWWRYICVDCIDLVLPSTGGTISTIDAEVIDQGPRILGQRYSCVAACQEHYYRAPPNIGRGYGAYLYDSNGRAYLDMVNNVAIIGHCHPKVTKMAAKQANLLNTNSRFIYKAMGQFAEDILSAVPENIRRNGQLNRVFFVNSGSEATDLALRIARVVASARNRHKSADKSLTRDVICIQGGYHGVSTASDEVSTTLNDNPNSLSTRAPWIHLVPMPNLFRGIYRSSDHHSIEELATKYADFVRDKVKFLQEKGIYPSAFIAEPLSGNAGGVEIPPGYLSQVYECIRSAGGLCICDEVQVGYGRLGNSFWGFEEHGIVPDIITMAKAAGNGHPVGFVVTSEQIVNEFKSLEGSFFSSAGGGPVSCITGSTVLEVLKEEKLQENANVVGKYLNEGLLKLRAKYPNVVGCIHGHGFYQGIEIIKPSSSSEADIPCPGTAEAYAICERLLELGVICHNTGDYSNVLKVKPPLCFSKEDADFCLLALDIALQGW